MFLLANIFLNYDTGVIPASLLEIVKEIELDFKDQALLGSLVYLGLSFASLFVTLIFNKYGPAKVCSYVLILNTLCCFVFSFSKVKLILYACRFAMGISEAFIVIYGPVWVNNYSPPEHSAKWMGILHSCTALGVILGYLVAGLTINFLSHILTWRFAIQIQGIVQIPLALYFYFEDERFINVDTSLNNDEGEIENSADDTVRASIRKGERQLSDQAKGTQIGQNPTKTAIRDTTRQKSQRSKTVAYTRRNTRIDAVETSNLKRYCSQTYVTSYHLIIVCVK